MTRVASFTQRRNEHFRQGFSVDNALKPTYVDPYVTIVMGKTGILSMTLHMPFPTRKKVVILMHLTEAFLEKILKVALTIFLIVFLLLLFASPIK